MKNTYKILLLFALLAFAFVKPCHAQEIVYENFDDPPVPPGGDEGYAKYLRDHIHYPQAAIDAGAQGTVQISIVVDKDGTLSEVKILKDSAHYGCAEEAVRVIKMMPPWKPGRISGSPVKVRYTVPVRFQLGGNAVANSPAEPVGGMTEINTFIGKNLKYPQTAIDANAQGIVYVSFIVNKRGKLTHIEIKKDEVGHGCGKEAMRVVRKMKRWKPATQNGKRVKVKYTLPVRFRLE